MNTQINRLNKKLEQLGQYKPSAKDIVEHCYNNLTKNLSDGWSFEQLSKFISEEGQEISAQTLKTYYNKIKLSKKTNSEQIKK